MEMTEETVLPRALIIGGGDFALFLSDKLQENGCSADAIDSYPTHKKQSFLSYKFDYLFLFTDFDSLPEILHKFLKPEGKLLLVTQDGEEIDDFYLKQNVNILKIGDLVAWPADELAEKIFKTIFSSSSRKIINVRKKAQKIQVEIPVIKSVSKEDLKDHLFKPVSLPSSQSKLKVTTRINLLPIFLTLVVIFLFSSVVLAGFTYLYVKDLSKIFSNFQTHLVTSDIEAIGNDFSQAKKKIQLGKSVYNFTYNILIPFQEVKAVKDIGVVFSSSSELITSGEEVVGYFQKFTSMNTASLADFEITIKKIDNLILSLSQTKSRLDQVSLPYFPKSTFNNFLTISLDKLITLRQLLPIAQKIIITEKKTTYLVLFQNNMELRPTGGFIGSYGLLTFENGKIADFQIYDVYAADGQLKGHVEPPLPIRKYLNQPNWFLRDSNFDPDFALSADQAIWFLEKETGQKADGVIGINLNLLLQLLRSIGPVTLPDFRDEIITSDNFYFKTQSYSQNDFFPGSSAKKDFLSSLTKAMEIKLTTGTDIRFLDVLISLKNSLEEKNILLYSTDENIQKEIEKTGWAGRMSAVACLENFQKCFPDFLAVNEANLGVNKANYFISKSTAVEKRLSANGDIVSTVTISYENKSLPNLLTASHYRNYLRFFVPSGSRLMGATFNGKFITPNSIETTSYANDKTSFGFLVDIPPDSQAVVKVSYVLSKQMTKDSSSYQLFFQKQGGDKNSPLIISIIYPSGMNMKPLNFKSTAGRPQETYYTTDTSVDRIFSLEVTQ